MPEPDRRSRPDTDHGPDDAGRRRRPSGETAPQDGGVDPEPGAPCDEPARPDAPPTICDDAEKITDPLAEHPN